MSRISRMKYVSGSTSAIARGSAGKCRVDQNAPERNAIGR